MIENRCQIGGNVEREVALNCLIAGINAADPATVIPERIVFDGNNLVVDGDTYDLEKFRRIIIVGGGNAAGTVAAALERILDDWISGGAVITDNPVETNYVSVLLGDHPVPSRRGVESTREMIEVAEQATSEDLVLAIITGGGSALMPAPAEGISLNDLQTTTESLLISGATIHEMNIIRKHLSDCKGGQLLRSISPAMAIGIVLSDVIGNDLDVIASGPLAPDDSSFEDALSIIDRYEVEIPTSVKRRLFRGSIGEIPETPNSNDPIFQTVRHYVVADGKTALDGAAAMATEHGYEPLILSSRIRGEASEVAKAVAGIAEECVTTGEPINPPAVLLSGGETTVTVRSDGNGGPNQEFTLSCALELTVPNVTVACVDTDGIDGNSGAAGGIAMSDSISSQDKGLEYLRENNSATFLKRSSGLIITGPTNTNVNDLRVLVLSDRT